MIFRTSWSRLIPFSSLILGIVGITAQTQVPQDQITPEPLDAIVGYSNSRDLADPVTQLQKRIASGKTKLSFESKDGYLRSVLKELKIPVESQLLIFSKTSCQAPYTSPQKPRALYYKDNVYIGYAQGDVLDLIGIDPVKGPIFFTLEQKQSIRPTFKREIRDCVQCHLGPETVNVPGLVVRSVRTNENGKPISQVQNFVSGHNNPLPQRWGGWYVTGTHEGDNHLGNGYYAVERPTDENLKKNSNITDLKSRFDTTQYPTPFSDTVALLVLDHTVRMQNFITEAQYETVIAQKERKDPKIKLVDNSNWRIKNAGESLLNYMLFRDEAALHGKITGTSGFQEAFSKFGPRDKMGRSLYDLDLNTRVFKYSCSYLIYSKTFDTLPSEMKNYLWGRLSQILIGRDTNPRFVSMSSDDRSAVLDILLDTKPEFAAWCRNHPQK